jgi:lipopolysaccharide/colanic/teichoic acid biosynthesis glycosyltransferase
MEPDILATPSPRMPGERLSSESSEPATHAHLVEPMTPTSAPHRTPAAPANGHAHGHAGGHLHAVPRGHANGHPNGHAHARPLGRWTGAAAVALEPGLEHVFEVREAGVYLRFGKRLLDIAGAAIALVLTAPVLLLAAALIKLESRGPVIYRSTRIGRGGRPFTFFKLRSMVNDADQMRHRLSHLNECDGPVFKISRDPRVTRVGRFLRSTSIDEIPQFINVLRGEMSLVGPRPPIPEEVAKYEPWQMRRLDVAPGITCLWQISGRSRIGFQEWMRLDLEYIRNRSFAMDLKILLRTIPAVLSREGAY